MLGYEMDTHAVMISSAKQVEAIPVLASVDRPTARGECLQSDQLPWKCRLGFQSVGLCER